MVICLIIEGLPLGTRSISSTIIQILDELEGSARVHGATWTQFEPFLSDCDFRVEEFKPDYPPGPSQPPWPLS